MNEFVKVEIIVDNHTHENNPCPKGSVIDVHADVAETLITHKIAKKAKE